MKLLGAVKGEIHTIPISIVWAGACVFGLLSGCADVDNFNDPFVQESFTGAVAITPSMKGMYPGGRFSGMVTIVGDENGKSVTLYGLPKNEPFELWPRTDPFEAPPTVSGFVAEVVDDTTLKVVSFADLNTAAEDLDLVVTGYLHRSGPKLETVPGHPIVISGVAGYIKDAIPKMFLDRIVRIEDDATIDEIDDEEVVPLYQVKVGTEVISIL